MSGSLEYSSGESGDGDSGELKFGTGDAVEAGVGISASQLEVAILALVETSTFKLVKQQVVPQVE